MRNIENSHGKPTLIFVLEFDRVTGGMMHSITSLIKEICVTYNVIIIAPKGELALSMDNLPVKTIEINNVKFWHSKNPLKRLKLIFDIGVNLQRLAVNPKVVITNNIYAQFLVSICSYFLRFKLIYFNRGGNLKNKISRLVIILSHRINLVISTSNNQKTIVECSGILNHGAKSVVLFNPVSLSLPSTISTNNLNKNKYIIGIVGYIDNGKNQLLALDALSILLKKKLNVTIHLYGEANNPIYLAEIKDKISDLALSENVVFKGFTSDKIKLYQDIDLLLSTSIAEGFGRTIVEAMLVKKPVVALKIAGGPADIILSEEYGQLVDDNAEAVAKAVEKVIVDESYRTTSTENAYHYASETFNPKTIAKHFISILENKVL